jgi:hypothetical protein
MVHTTLALLRPRFRSISTRRAPSAVSSTRHSGAAGAGSRPSCTYAPKAAGSHSPSFSQAGSAMSRATSLRSSTQAVCAAALRAGPVPGPGGWSEIGATATARYVGSSRGAAPGGHPAPTRPATRGWALRVIRPRSVPGAQPGRALGEPPQAASAHRHPLREARCALPRDAHARGAAPLALTAAARVVRACARGRRASRAQRAQAA